MQGVRVTLLSRRGAGSLPADTRASLAARHVLDEHRLSAAPTSAQAARLLAGAHVLASTNACLPVLDDRLLRRIPQLRAVVLYATGHDHLDPEVLARADVELTVLPDYATSAVAEHAVALLMALATRLHLANDRSRGLAPKGVSLRGTELGGKVLGVVGLGRIGSHVARLATGLGMRVLGTDPRADQGPPSVQRRSLVDLLRASDAVCLCASRTHGAPPLIGAGELEEMRPGAWLVNPARAALVDTGAVVTAVRSGKLRGYAVDDTVLDVVEHADLLSEGRVLQTGHSAWWREEALERGDRLWGAAILEVADRCASLSRLPAIAPSAAAVSA